MTGFTVRPRFRPCMHSGFRFLRQNESAPPSHCHRPIPGGPTTNWSCKLTPSSHETQTHVVRLNSQPDIKTQTHSAITAAYQIHSPQTKYSDQTRLRCKAQSQALTQTSSQNSRPPSLPPHTMLSHVIKHDTHEPKPLPASNSQQSQIQTQILAPFQTLLTLGLHNAAEKTVQNGTDCH